MRGFFEVSRSGYYDFYDNSIVACKTAAQQTVNLVPDTIRLAVQAEKEAAGSLHLHSGQGFQYTSQAYFNLTRTYGITPSMSRRGNCYDNAMAENFFSILKTECIYRQKISTFQQARDLIDDFIYFYNHERIQLKTGVAPLTLRHSTKNSLFPAWASFLCCPHNLGRFTEGLPPIFLLPVLHQIGDAVQVIHFHNAQHIHLWLDNGVHIAVTIDRFVVAKAFPEGLSLHAGPHL